MIIFQKRKYSCISFLCLFGLLLIQNECKLNKQIKSSAVNESLSQIRDEQKNLTYDFQKVDHFDPFNENVYKQRYWQLDKFYKPDGPVFLCVCGEYTCPGIASTRLYPVVLAEKFNGLILVLEHRFYGASMPFDDESMKTENLKYLTVDNALADLAQFIQHVKTNFAEFNISPDAPFITIGGSYPGALSAWFRYKYPHLTVGALASSAVILPILDFLTFDEQVYTSTHDYSGEYCNEGIHSLTKFIDDQLDLGGNDAFEMKVKFKAENLTDAEFMFFIADTMAEMVQYASREELCSWFVAELTIQDSFTKLLDYANSGGNDPTFYGYYYLQNTTYDINKDGRQWAYQSCNQFGWYQTFNPDFQKSMRSKRVTLESFQFQCQQLFGLNNSQQAWPNVNYTNTIYGGREMQPFNLIFVNGVEDPWQHASMRPQKNHYFESLLAECNECAHCVDLNSPTASDSKNLQDIRLRTEWYFKKWIRDHWKAKFEIQGTVVEAF